MEETSPESVLSLGEATPGFLCSLSANVYGIEFVYFKVRELTTGMVLFEVSADEDEN